MLPLVHPSAMGAPVAIAQGEIITLSRFLSDIAIVAGALPERRFVLNLCSDRYRFVVGLAAALVRGQITLLPPDHTPQLVGQISSLYPGLYGLADRQEDMADLACVAYPETQQRVAQECSVPEFPADQVAAHVFTSGSTGQPTPHAKTWGSLVAGTRAAARALQIERYPGASLLGTVPPQHMYGLESTVLLAVQHGLLMDNGRPLYPADIAGRLEALARPRILVTTPVHLSVLLADAEALPACDLVVCATAPLSPRLAAEAERRFAAPLYEIYGCTEAGQLATRRTVDGPLWQPFPGIVLHTEGDAVYATGGPVEVEARLHDVIELHAGGGFLLHGRIADLVNVAGKRTSLASLNFHLNSIPGVVDGVFVVPEDSTALVTRLMAFVVAPDVSDEALIHALRTRIDPAFLPRPLLRVESLPRNTTGKLPRAALARLIAEATQV